jgi:hypothetical protein
LFGQGFSINYDGIQDLHLLEQSALGGGIGSLPYQVGLCIHPDFLDGVGNLTCLGCQGEDMTFMGVDHFTSVQTCGVVIQGILLLGHILIGEVRAEYRLPQRCSLQSDQFLGIGVEEVEAALGPEDLLAAFGNTGELYQRVAGALCPCLEGAHLGTEAVGCGNGPG